MFAPRFRYHCEDNMLSEFRFDIRCATRTTADAGYHRTRRDSFRAEPLSLG